MKSPDPHDSIRLNVQDVKIGRPSDPYCTHDLIISVDFIYNTWEPSSGQDILWEQANALTCLREVLRRGGMADQI